MERRDQPIAVGTASVSRAEDSGCPILFRRKTAKRLLAVFFAELEHPEQFDANSRSAGRG
jgi:hypothetical protein